MTEAILLLACLVLAGAVVGLGVAVGRLRDRVRALETSPAGSGGLVTGASAPSSTNEVAPASTNDPLVEEVAQRPSRDQGSGGLVTGASAPSSTNEVAPSSTGGHEEYVITRVGSPDVDDAGQAALGRPDARLFADLVLRESVVKAASFAYGVRRGLSPANRNRIRFEMRREVRRARKDRKAEEREAIREWRARQRAAVRDRSREDDAA